MFSRSFRRYVKGLKKPSITTKARPKARLALELLEVREVPATISAWTFENNAIAINNSPTPSTGSGTATPLGMTNSYNGTTSTTTADVLAGSSGDTGTNTLADTTQIWRVRGQNPGNGWSSQAPIGTQGAEFAVSTAGYSGTISVGFDWYATNQGEANLQLLYTDNVNATTPTWTNVPITVPSADTDVAALTNTTSSNTVNGAYVQISGGQNWAPNLTASITDSAAANNPNFAIELVNASTGADCISAVGGALNNTSGNWRFDNIIVAAGSLATTSSSLAASPASPQLPGTNVTLTDTVSSNNGVASGSVAFFDGTTLLATQPITGGSSSAQASLIVNTSGSPLTLGAHSFTAQYSVNGTVNSTSNAVGYTIGDPTSSILTATPSSPQQVNTTVSITDTITPANIGGTSSPEGNPTGTVQFYDNGTAIGSAMTVTAGSGSTGTVTYVSNGTANPFLTSGTHNITAIYTPTQDFLGSTTPALGYAIYSGQPGPFTPGNLVILQAGDGTTQYNSQAPLYLNEVNPSSGGNVQQASIPAVGAAAIATASESGTTVTMTTASAPGLTGNGFTTGESIAIFGVSPSGYDGTFVITATGTNTFTYTASSGLGTATLSGATATPGQVGNQAITLDLSAAAGNGQLNRTADGSGLTFDGVDSTVNNDGLTQPATPTGQNNRDVAIVSGDPTVTSNINTTIFGPFYVGDDNRGSVAVSPTTGPLYTAGHPNQAGGAVSQGVHEVDSTNGATTGAQIGNQVSASTNIRGVTIGFDNRMYFSTASGLGGTSALNAAGIFTEAQALPTSTSTTPANDIMVVPAIFGASKLGGVWLADMNGDGILDNGDRLYFLDDGTVGGSGTGGVYVSTWNSGLDQNPWNTASSDAITAASWAGGTATITANNDFTVGQSVTVAGIGGATGFNGTFTIASVIGSAGNQTGFTYALSTDPTNGGALTPTFAVATANIPSNNAAAAAAGFVDHWSVPVQLGDAPVQPGSGGTGQLRGLTGTVVDAGISSASESGTTVTITLSGSNPFQAGQNVEISGVGAGYDGSWTITAINGSTFTYTATTSGLSSASPSNGLASQAVMYTSAFDNSAGDYSVIQQWVDTNTGAGVASAAESGHVVTITTAAPNTFQTGQVVEVDGVGANSGAGAITSGYNGAWTITVVDSTHFTYTDSNASNLATVANQGAADVAIQTDASQAAQFSNFGIGTGPGNTLGGAIIQTLAGGTDTVGGKSFADVGLRGVSFAPVDATGVTLAQSPANPLTPGTAVTLVATLTNAQVTPTGEVTFIDENTNTILGQAPILTTGGTTTATFVTSSVVGQHYVQAYFGGGGTLALAPARSNTIQVQEYGTTTSTTGLAANPTAAAIGHSVTLTATVTSGATGTVSFYNGSVSLANLLGTSPLSGTTATLTTAFTAAGAESLIAVYNGDGTYAPSQGTATVNVAPNATATITSSANNVAKGSVQTYTATIVGNGTLGTPGGQVTFTIVSATAGTNGKPLVSQTSSAITLTPGPNNTATALWTGPALSAAGSYFVTVSYKATGSSNPYSNFAVTTASAANGVPLIETVQQAFTPGDVVAVQRGDGTVNLGSSAYPVEIVEYAAGGGTEVQAIVMPDTNLGSQHALFLSGQNGAEGLLNRSANGYYLTLAGYDLPGGHTFITSTFPYQFPRTIALINGSASVDTSTAISTVQVGITAASESGTTVTINATSVTGLSVGQSVVITGVSPTGYDGQFTITAINTSTKTFTYTAASGLGTATVTSAFATTSAVPYNPLDVVSADGKEFWMVSNLPVGDTTDNGVEYVGSDGATTATQIGSGNSGAASVGIAGGQLYVTKGSGNVDTVGSGLPTTAGQALTGLPNFFNAYQEFFPNSENPEEVLLLNTNDGTTNNPNVAYVADQSNGLLKFFLNSANISSLSESGTTVTVNLSAAPGTNFTSGDQVQIAGASVAGYNGIFTITVVSSTKFTYTSATSGLGSATGGTASEWLLGQNGTGAFGEKLIFAGGATSIVGYVVNPGSSAQVQLYMTGSNVQQQNPNQIDSLLDTNAPSQGFPSGTVTVNAFVGGAGGTGSPNGNENFAGLAFVPGYVTSTTLADTGPDASNTITATVTSVSGHVPTGVVIFSLDGIVLGQSTLNGSGVATFADGSYPTTGSHVITAAYQGDVQDGTSNGTLTQGASQIASGDLLVTTVNTTSGATAINEFLPFGGAAAQTITMPSSFIESASSSAQGYVTESADLHTATFAGYVGTTSGNGDIAVINANGSIESSTQIASSQDGGAVKATVSADGLGMWIATSHGVQYVPFGNNALTPSTTVTNWLSQPTTVAIGSSNPGASGAGDAGQLFFDGGAGGQSNGIANIDGPVQIGAYSGTGTEANVGLPNVGGQSGTILGFPTARDGSNNFPASNQIAISPDGNTIFVADSRVDGSGGILEYFQATAGSWALVGSAQAGSGADSGLLGLSAAFGSGTVTLYATTTGTDSKATGNRTVSITGGTLDGSTPFFTYSTVETAAAGTSFRGVAVAPTAIGIRGPNVSVSVSGSPGAYPGGVTLSATVSGSAGTPTGYVEFLSSTGTEIGAAALNGAGVAVLRPGSNFQVGYSGTVTAAYTGDVEYAPLTATGTATVNKGATTTALTTQFNPVATGVPDALSAQVSYTSPPLAQPTGTVTFWDGTIGSGTNLGTVPLTATIVNVGGNPTIKYVAGLTTTFTTTGSHNISAVYSGDSNFGTSTGTGSVSVVNGTVVTVTTNNTDPKPTPAATVTYVATITSADTTDTISGTVQFYDGLLPIGSAQTVSGTSGVQATISVTTALVQAANVLTPGEHSISAIYTPDTNGAKNFFTNTGVYEQAVQAQAFGAGDTFVYRVGDGTTNLIAQAPNPNAGTAAIGSTIYVDEYTAGGTLVQSIALPTADSQAFAIGSATESGSSVTITTASPENFAVGDTVTIAGVSVPGYNGTFLLTGATGTTITYTDPTTGLTNGSGGSATGAAHAVVGNGQQSSTGQMTLSADGQYLFVAGYDNNPINVATAAAIPTGPGSGSVNRSIARIKYDGTIQEVAMSAGNSGSGFGNFNAVYSPDGNQFYVAGNGGVAYYSSFSPSSGLASPTATMNSPGGTTTALEAMGTSLAVIGAPGFGNDGPEAYSGYPTSAVSVASLPGFSDTAATGGGQASTFYIDAYFTHQNGTGAPAGVNTMYLSDDGPSFAKGAITKWALNVGSISSATESTNTVTITATAPLAFVNGQTVSIANVGVAGYNGTFTITGVSGNTFTYTDATSGLASSSGGTASQWQAVDHITAGTGNNMTSFYYLAGTTDANGNVTLSVTYGNGGNSDAGPGQLGVISDTNGYAGKIGTGGTHSDTVTITASTTSTSNEVFRGVAAAALPLVQSVTVNAAATVSISTATESTNTVTITTATPHAFYVGEPVTIASVGVAGYNGTFYVASIPTATSFTYNDPTSGLGSSSGGTAANALAGAQRSMVDTVVYKFNQPVNLGAGAFTFGVLGTSTISAASESSSTVTITTALAENFAVGQVVTVAGVGVAGYNGTWTITSIIDSTDFTYTDTNTGLAASSGGTVGVGNLPGLSYTSPDGGFTWVVTFTGGTVSGNSIADGAYNIFLNPSAITMAITGTGVVSTNRATDTFYRLFGDNTGVQTVNPTDSRAFARAFNSTAGSAAFVAAFDFNGDGAINTADSRAFAKRFGVVLSGFAPTI